MKNKKKDENIQKVELYLLNKYDFRCKSMAKKVCIPDCITDKSIYACQR